MAPTPINDPTDGLPRKLSRYSTIAASGLAGSMAVFESSEAAMVVTNTSITLSNDPIAVPTAEIDLNSLDGTPSVADLRVTVVTASLVSAQGINGGFLAGMDGPGGFFYPTAFQAPSTIGPALGFGAGSTVPPNLNSFGTLANGSIYGNWTGNGPESAYLGVVFDINGSDHYGWVHVTWDPVSDTATIDQFAYQDVAGAPALIPEPSSLALLGLGAVGLAVRRRRQEAENAG